MVVLYPYFLAKDMRSKGRDHVQKYATEYDLEHGEMRDVLDNWNIAKRSKNDGTLFLSIYRIMGLDKPVDYMHFEVYDSEADAEIEYLNLKKEYKTDISNPMNLMLMMERYMRWCSLRTTSLSLRIFPLRAAMRKWNLHPLPVQTDQKSQFQISSTGQASRTISSKIRMPSRYTFWKSCLRVKPLYPTSARK